MGKLILFFKLVLFVGCAQAALLGSDGYPDTWWQRIPDDQVKSWEYPPHSADRSKKEVILSKRNELGQFSNLSDVSFTMDGQAYGSLEGLWQGMKYPDPVLGNKDERLKNPDFEWPYTREQVFKMKGFEAKKAGDQANALMKQLGIRYITYQGEKVEHNGSGVQRHYEIIFKASENKVLQNPNLKKLLLSTAGLTFFPDHKQHANPTPAYLYHKIYQDIRESLLNKSQH